MSRYSRENMQKCRRNEQIFEGKYAKMRRNEQIFEGKYAKMLEKHFIKKNIFDCNQQIFEGKSSYMILLFSFLKKWLYLRENVKINLKISRNTCIPSRKQETR